MYPLLLGPWSDRLVAHWAFLLAPANHNPQFQYHLVRWDHDRVSHQTRHNQFWTSHYLAQCPANNETLWAHWDQSTSWWSTRPHARYLFWGYKHEVFLSLRVVTYWIARYAITASVDEIPTSSEFSPCIGYLLRWTRRLAFDEWVWSIHINQISGKSSSINMDQVLFGFDEHVFQLDPYQSSIVTNNERSQRDWTDRPLWHILWRCSTSSAVSIWSM